MSLLLMLMACMNGPPSPGQAKRWARAHSITLEAVSMPAERLLAGLPSLPGDPFTCSALTLPPELPEAQRLALVDSLCRQQQALWAADRFALEEQRGTELLTGSFLHYGVVGTTLSLAGPEGPEWVDHRGVTALTGEGAVAAEGSGVLDEHGAELGYGWVDLSLQPGTPELHPAFEWLFIARRREATAKVHVFVQVDGYPNGDFVQHALSP